MRLKSTPTEIKHKRLLASLKKKKSAQKIKNKKSVGFHGQYKTYKDFLKSAYWKDVRKLVLSRDNHQCLMCKSRDNLQVHHDTYIHHLRELEFLTDLRTLCGKCHKEHHGIKIKNKKTR